MLTQPRFVVSLDFELHWGIMDRATVAQSRDYLLQTIHHGIPRILGLFTEFGIHATWATVGFLFFEGRDELLAGLPQLRPSYENFSQSPYWDLLDIIGENEREDPFHFAPSLIQTIAEHPGQEIATHTFSHYYAMEPGQDAATFRADLAAAIKIARRRGHTMRSIVFPRNQCNYRYLGICREAGIRAVRGNPRLLPYKSACRKENTLFMKSVRTADLFIPLIRNHLDPPTPRALYPVDLPGSRFLRPFNPRLGVLERLRLARTLSDMTRAAQLGRIFHLWWHPHNFGYHLQENVAFLRRVLQHFTHLRAIHDMRSMNMNELAEELVGEPRRAPLHLAAVPR